MRKEAEAFLESIPKIDYNAGLQHFLNALNLPQDNVKKKKILFFSNFQKKNIIHKKLKITHY